jgi:hypothetical protein
MKRFFSLIISGALLLTLSLPTSHSLAEEAAQDTGSYSTDQARRPGFFSILGSIVFTTIHVPSKLLTCVATQASAAVFYTQTFGVEGAYEGGTNGRDIGETARRSCTGPWIVRPSHVVRDYGE